MTMKLSLYGDLDYWINTILFSVNRQAINVEQIKNMLSDHWTESQLIFWR